MFHDDTDALLRVLDDTDFPTDVYEAEDLLDEDAAAAARAIRYGYPPRPGTRR